MVALEVDGDVDGDVDTVVDGGVEEEVVDGAALCVAALIPPILSV